MNEAEHRKFKSCSEDWLSSLEHHLGGYYKLMVYQSMWQIRIAVFVHIHHAHHIRNIKKTSEATGIAHLMGNKGAVCVSLTFRHMSFCFVNCHLAAHQHKTSRRNADVMEILQGITLNNKKMDILTQV